MEELMTKLNELAPDVVEQMLNWGIFSNWLGVVVCSLLILGYAGAFWPCLKKADDWDEDFVMPILVIGGIVTIWVVVFLIATIATLVQIYYWPYAYIVDILT